MQKALIIFVRNPELGKVKTRLAAQIGAKPALAIYLKLLQHTRLTALQTNCKKYVFATETLHDDFWKGFGLKEQNGGNLGEKMMDAFEQLLNKGYIKVVIIGSDCPHLKAQHIEEAFDGLNSNDIVIGPANDGGYYLLGMKKMHPAIFQNKSWSTAFVFNETIATIKMLQLSFHQLEALTDVDEASDVPKEWLSQLSMTI
jgi:rSAM/selenodomain-associated transferase 1